MRVREIAVAIVSIGASVFLARFLHGVTPIGQWLLWDLLRLWGWLLLLGAAVASAGHLLLAQGFGFRPLPTIERWALAGPCGLVIFAAGMYLAGLVGLYGPGFAVSWPLVLVAVGGRAAWTEVRTARLAWRARPKASVLVLATAGCAAGGMVLLYLGLLSPDAVNYDAAWMHLTIAQDYAREGRIVRFPGDWVRNVPHLASVVYTWGFLVPGFDHAAQRWMMALHIELGALLWTLVGIAAAVRFLVGDRPVRAAWAALMLFPGIFVYDSNLGGAADHLAAFFAIPLLLTGARLLEQPRGPRWLLLGLLSAGAMLTKLQALYVVAPLAAALGLVLARAALAPSTPLRSRTALVLWPLAGMGLALAVVSLHFGKNWVEFGNPFYPFLQDKIASTPFLPGAADQVNNLLADRNSQAPGPLGAKLRSALEVLITFPFVPHYSFVNNRPVFGPLFSLSLLMLPALRAGRRLWLAAAMAVGMVFMWAATYRVDRNLQVFLPILVAVTAALLWKAWRLGLLARLGVAALVGLQVVWGADLMFSGSDRINSSITLIRSAFDGRAETRYAGYRRAHVELGQALPPHAVVVLHTTHRSLGLDRRVLLDWMGFQGLIDYRTMTSARDVYDRFAALGVTHIVTVAGTDPPGSRQEEVVFAAFLTHATSQGDFHGLRLFAMPSQPPPAPAVANPPVLVLGLLGYADGLYRLGDLSTCESLPVELRQYQPPQEAVVDLERRWSALDDAAAAIVGNDVILETPLAERLRREFQSSSSRAGFTVYFRPAKL